MFLHCVNYIEHDIKQNIYTDMEVMSYTSMILYIKAVTLNNDASGKITNFHSDLFFKEHC